MVSRQKPLAGIVLDEQAELTLSDLCRCCSARRETIIALIDEGVISPVAREGRGYRFSAASVKRATRAVRLKKELELNLPGVALALDLLDEIERLRDRLLVYERRSER